MSPYSLSVEGAETPALDGLLVGDLRYFTGLCPENPLLRRWAEQGGGTIVATSSEALALHTDLMAYCRQKGQPRDGLFAELLGWLAEALDLCPGSAS